MAEKTFDVMQQMGDRHVMVRFVAEPGRLRAVLSIPNGTGEEDIDPGDVSLEVSCQGQVLRRVQDTEPRQVRTQTRGVTVHFLYELEPPLGAELGTAAQQLSVTVTFRGERRTFEVRL